MLMLRFQDALASERWEEALSFCSDRVRTNAAQWASPEAFFKDTLPIEVVLAHDFQPAVHGTKDGKATLYGMFVPCSQPDATPGVQWYWTIASDHGAWVVDYTPVKLDSYVRRREAEIQQRDQRIQQVRQDLALKAKGVSIRLIAVSERFVVGEPMLFRVELVNSSPALVHYMDRGVRYHGWIVRNEKKEPVPYSPLQAQIGVGQGKLAAGSSVVLADKIDINGHHEITKPGRYLVQYNSAALAIGEPFPREPAGCYGECFFADFLAATNVFPSNLIEIKVRR